MKSIFQRLFPFLGLLVLLLFFGLVLKDYQRPYLKYQHEFKQSLIKVKAAEREIRDFQWGIRQRWVKALDRADRCETCHLAFEDPRFPDAAEPFKAHPDMTTHAFEKIGCTVCHGGQGAATTLEDAHGPCVNWNDALYHEDFMQNSCALCHGEFIGEKAPVFTAGKQLFDQDGCRGCHKVKGKERTKVGPPLDAMGKRVKADWLYRWLRNPRSYLPRTRMPDAKLTEQEAADMAALLLQGPKATEVEVHGSAERGKVLFAESRCVSCHKVEGKGGKIGPDLAKISSKTYAQWLLEVIQDPHKLWSESQMPIFGFGDQEIQDLLAFMLQDYTDLDLDEEQSAKQTQMVQQANSEHGREPLEKHGCTGCHDKIEGVKDRGEIGVELTTIADIHISRLDFGDITVAHKDRTVPNYLYNKIRNPRMFKKTLIMPVYSFTESEVEALTTYLLSLKSQEVPATYRLPLGDPPSSYAPQGKFGKLLDKYRCLVCHKIQGRGGEMATDLSQEGSRVQKVWLQRFMKSPDTIRPLLEERMTQFKMLDAEIDTLYDYLRASLVDDRVEDLENRVGTMKLDTPDHVETGKGLYFEKYACDSCHQINLKGGTIGPDLTHLGKRLRPEWVVYYLHAPKAFVKRSVEPVYAFTGAETEALTSFLLSLQ